MGGSVCRPRIIIMLLIKNNVMIRAWGLERDRLSVHMCVGLAVREAHPWRRALLL